MVDIFDHLISEISKNLIALYLFPIWTHLNLQVCYFHINSIPFKMGYIQIIPIVHRKQHIYFIDDAKWETLASFFLFENVGMSFSFACVAFNI